MFKNSLKVSIIFLILPIVILNQNEYEYNDYSDDYYPPPPQTHRNRGHRIALFKAQEKKNPRSAKNIGIVDSVFGLIAGGKCLIKCALRIVKNCGGTIDCVWTCFLPQQPLDFPKPKNDDADIKMQPIDDHTHDLTPKDVANIASCFIKCLMRYLPTKKESLFTWLHCFITQCICFGPKGSPKI